MNERSGNVYENKGPLWEIRERSLNVIENKGTYGFKTGMLLKANDLFLGEYPLPPWRSS
jgi:hypothetical protein